MAGCAISVANQLKKQPNRVKDFKVMIKIQKAEKALHEACENNFQLKACIPADPKRDHDLIIADALAASQSFYEKVNKACKAENWGGVVEALLEFEE